MVPVTVSPRSPAAFRPWVSSITSNSARPSPPGADRGSVRPPSGPGLRATREGWPRTPGPFRVAWATGVRPHLGWDEDPPEQSGEQIELSDVGEGDEQRGVGDDNHRPWALRTCSRLHRSLSRSSLVRPWS
jgi:hypothetical protein